MKSQLSTGPLNPIDAAMSPIMASVNRMRASACGPVYLSNPKIVIEEAEKLLTHIIRAKEAAQAVLDNRAKAENDARSKIVAPEILEEQRLELQRRREEQSRREVAFQMVDGLAAGFMTLKG